MAYVTLATRLMVTEATDNAVARTNLLALEFVPMVQVVMTTSLVKIEAIMHMFVSVIT